MLTFKDLSVEFGLIRNGEIFWMNNNPSYGSQSQHTKSATHWFGINTKNIYFTYKQHFEFNAVIFEQIFLLVFTLFRRE